MQERRGRNARLACHLHQQPQQSRVSSTVPLPPALNLRRSRTRLGICRCVGLGAELRLRRSRRQWVRSPLRRLTSHRKPHLLPEGERNAIRISSRRRIILRVGISWSMDPEDSTYAITSLTIPINNDQTIPALQMTPLLMTTIPHLHGRSLSIERRDRSSRHSDSIPSTAS